MLYTILVYYDIIILYRDVVYSMGRGSPLEGGSRGRKLWRSWREGAVSTPPAGSGGAGSDSRSSLRRSLRNATGSWAGDTRGTLATGRREGGTEEGGRDEGEREGRREGMEG